MPSDSLRRAAGLPTSVGIAILAVVVSAPFARLDFDPHHDGVMVAAAVAVRDGLVVQRDVFAQYGPVTPLLQGWFLKVGLDPTLGIRLLNVLVIGLVAFAIADLGRKMPGFWPVSLSAGRWASLAWIVLADFFLWVPQLPWSSTIAAAMTAWALLLVGRSLNSLRDETRLPWQVPAVAAGAVIALLPFTRLNVGLATVAAGSLVAVLAVVVIPTTRRLAGWIAGGWLTCTLLVAGLLLLKNALLPWWQQAVLWPWSWVGLVGSQLGPDLLLRRTVTAFWPALVAIGVIVIFAPLRNMNRSRSLRWIAALSLVTSVGLLFALYRNPGLERSYLADQTGVRESLIDGLTRSGLVLLTLMVAIVLLIATIRACKVAYSLVKEPEQANQALAWLALIGFSMAGLVQYAPVPDSRHIWWGLPLGLLLVFASLGRSQLWSPTRNPLALPLAAAAIAALLSGSSYLEYERVPAPGNSVAAGMLSEREVSDRTREAFELLEENLGTETAVFLVAEGAWSVFDQSYHSPDAHFVDWGAPVDLMPRLARTRLAVTDDLALASSSVTLEALGFKQVDEGGGLQIWARPS